MYTLYELVDYLNSPEGANHHLHHDYIMEHRMPRLFKTKEFGVRIDGIVLTADCRAKKTVWLNNFQLGVLMNELAHVWYYNGMVHFNRNLPPIVSFETGD
jgi:hypothetical protein